MNKNNNNNSVAAARLGASMVAGRKQAFEAGLPQPLWSSSSRVPLTKQACPFLKMDAMLLTNFIEPQLQSFF